MRASYLKYLVVLLVFTDTNCLHIHQKSINEHQRQRHSVKDGLTHLVAWGHYNSNKSPESTIPNWLSGINDNTLVSMLSIPGTHDSGTYSCSWTQFCDISQCQSWDISNQLNAGIRFLDIRVNARDGYLAVGHGSFQFVTLTDFLNQISNFLKKNPREFVILAFQKNDGNRDPTTDTINLLQNVGINALYQSNIPTVGQLRGKAWIMGGYGMNFGGASKNTFMLYGSQGITDNLQIYLQNYYTLNAFQVSFKKTQVMNTANAACSPNRMKVNFLSGSGGVMPYWLAKIDGAPNQSLDVYLQRNPGKKCLGVTIMDYPGTRLIRQIVASN